MKAYWLPAHLVCATCGYAMDPMGRFEGGKVIVRCSGFKCPEYGIERKYVGTPVDLEEIAAGDMDTPLERESSELVQVDPKTVPATILPDAAPMVEVVDAVL